MGLLMKNEIERKAALIGQAKQAAGSADGKEYGAGMGVAYSFAHPVTRAGVRRELAHVSDAVNAQRKIVSSLKILESGTTEEEKKEAEISFRRSILDYFAERPATSAISWAGVTSIIIGTAASQYGSPKAGAIFAGAGVGIVALPFLPYIAARLEFERAEKDAAQVARVAADASRVLIDAKSADPQTLHAIIGREEKALGALSEYKAILERREKEGSLLTKISRALDE